jgi:hypothetical protein
MNIFVRQGAVYKTLTLDRRPVYSIRLYNTYTATAASASACARLLAQLLLLALVVYYILLSSSALSPS